MAAPDPDRVLFETRLHPASLAGTLTFAACVVGATALVVSRNPLAAETVVQLWLAATAVVAIAAVAPVLRWRASRFTVTRDRLTIRSGGLRRQHFEVPLAELAEISVSRGLLGNLLGYGTVRVVTDGNGAAVISRVAAADELREAVLRHPRAARRRPSNP
jgi:membrane protein YdbS with pleckstrin-like domain